MTTWILLSLAMAVLVLALAWLHYSYWVKRFTLDLAYELEERVATPDGSAIVLRRIPASEEHGRDGVPVLLVHGLAFNHRNHDMRDDLSLGRHLAHGGRDVWLLTLRSGRADLSFREERRTTFEAMARYDLPIGVDEVLRRTGADVLDYVGFSMGGMLLYAAVGRTVATSKLRRVSIIGSPAKIQPPFAILSTLARFVPHSIVPTMRLRFVSRFFSFAAEWLTTPLHHWIYNPRNVEPGMPTHALVNGFANIPGKLAAEFVRWTADGGVVRFEDSRVTDTLRAIDRPVLFIAGAMDRLAPPAAVALAFEAWGADCEVEKEMRIAGIDHGAAADYGHGDLAIGRFAEQDVFEPVLAFLGDGRSVRAQPSE